MAKRKKTSPDEKPEGYSSITTTNSDNDLVEANFQNLNLVTSEEKSEKLQKFYIKYLENQPIVITTHIFIPATGKWVQTVFDISDLIKEFFSDLSPLKRGQYTLHLPLNVNKYFN